MDRELLLEIGCEELPARWLPGLTNQLGEVVIAQLKEQRLTPEAPAETYSTPRRLTVRIARLSERQTDLEEVLNGPPVSAGFTADGVPTPAAVGFATKNGTDVASLEQIATPKGHLSRVSQEAAREGRGGRAAGGAGRNAPRPVVSEVDALGRDARRWQGRAAVRSSHPLAALHVWRTGHPVRHLAHAWCAEQLRAGRHLGCGHLRAPVPHDQRTCRPCHQGALLRRIQDAPARELRHARAQRAPQQDCPRARRQGAAAAGPRQPHGARRVRPAGRGARSRRVPVGGRRYLQPRFPRASRRSADDDADSPSALLSR